MPSIEHMWSIDHSDAFRWFCEEQTAETGDPLSALLRAEEEAARELGYTNINDVTAHDQQLISIMTEELLRHLNEPVREL